MNQLNEITTKIKSLKNAREILQNEYEKTEFHKKKEANPQEYVPPSPQDEEVYKLLTAIQQLDLYVKKLQDEQFQILKKEDNK